jgi:hypothetical protein
LQHVDRGACAGLVAGSVALKAWRSIRARAQRLDLRNLRQHAEVGIARIALRFARDPLEPLLGRAVQVDGLRTCEDTAPPE